MKSNQKPKGFKIILVGNSSVGKTTFSTFVSTGELPEKNLSTIGMDQRTLKCKIKDENNNEKEIEVKLWDTAGQERFRSITKSYFREFDGILFMYSIVDKTSFDGLSEVWIDSVNKCASESVNKRIYYLFGNKSDLVEQTNKEDIVTKEDAEELCAKNNIVFKGEHSLQKEPKEVFLGIIEEMAQELYKLNESNPKKENINLNDNNNNVKKKKLC